MSRHTSGPWMADPPIVGVNEGDIYIYNIHGRRIAAILGRDSYRRQHRANGNLIAAAPDLYTFVQEIAIGAYTLDDAADRACTLIKSIGAAQ